MGILVEKEKKGMNERKRTWELIAEDVKSSLIMSASKSIIKISGFPPSLLKEFSSLRGDK